MLDIYIGITLLVIGVVLLAYAIKLEPKHEVGRVGQFQWIMWGLLLMGVGIMFLSGLSHYEPKQEKGKTELYILSNYFNKC